MIGVNIHCKKHFSRGNHKAIECRVGDVKADKNKYKFGAPNKVDYISHNEICGRKTSTSSAFVRKNQNVPMTTTFTCGFIRAHPINLASSFLSIYFTRNFPS